MVSAIGIKRILYADTSAITKDIKTAEEAKTLIKAAIAGKKEVLNVHQDTWNIEESEASIDGFKNQLNGRVYRSNVTPGEVSVSFSIGQYAFATKAEFMGGEVIMKASTPVGWKRSTELVDMHKVLFCLTEDNVWFIFTNCKIVSREANTDKAIAIGVKGIVQEPKIVGVSSEYNFDESEVGALVG